MRKILLALLLLTGGVSAQITLPPSVVNRSSNPSGFCFPAYLVLNTISGDLSGCVGGSWTVLASGSGGGGSPYVATVSSQVTLSVPASTHGQGTLPIASCFDNSSPPVAALCGYTRAANGDIVLTWSPAFSGSVQISHVAGSSSGVLWQGTATANAVATAYDSSHAQTICAQCTLDSSGNYQTPGSFSSGVGGTANGALDLINGTGAPAITANSWRLTAPVTIATAFSWVGPNAGASGLVRGDLSGAVVTLTQTELSGDCLTSGSNAAICRPTVLTSTSGAVADPGGSEAYQFNNAAGALTFNVSAGVTGVRRCYRNATGKTGVITLQMAASNTVDYNGANGSTAGTFVSGGAAGDSVCLVSDTTNHWYAYVQRGTWTNN